MHEIQPSDRQTNGRTAESRVPYSLVRNSKKRIDLYLRKYLVGTY